MAGSGSPAATAHALAAMESEIRAAGAPYAPMTAALGSPASVNPDVPISAVFLAIFVICGILNVRHFIRNKKRGTKFVFSLTFGIFCLLRIVSACLRIAWACKPKNVHIAIAAGIFLYAGTVILYMVNLVFTQRLMRAMHPRIGWNKIYSILSVPVPLLVIISVVITVVTTSSISFFTLDKNTLRIEHNIVIAVLTTYCFFACLPMLSIAIMLIIPRRTTLDKFGTGSLRTKIILLFISSATLTLGIGWRAGTEWVPSVSTLERPWYFSKACFYLFNFTVECITLFLYLAFRADKRMYIPAGANAPGTYSGAMDKEEYRQWPDSLYLPRLDLENTDDDDKDKEKENDGPKFDGIDGADDARSMSEKSYRSRASEDMV